MRLRLWDLRLSRLPSIIGCCADNLPKIAEAVNTAQRRLLMAKEAGSEGWNGTWAEVAFNVNKETPYLTLPREIARLEKINVCTGPTPIYNQFFEYLRFGNGNLPKQCGGGDCGAPLGVYQRNNVPTFTNMTATSQIISVYPTNSEDVGRRVLLQGTSAGQTIYSRDMFSRVTGIFVTLQMPFVSAPMPFDSITGIQKDLTSGPIQIFQTDPNTGAQVLLHSMEPSETVASYQRYYLSPISNACCTVTGDTTHVPVTAIAKLDLVPVTVDTDYLLLTNIEAVIHECASVRYSEVDTGSAKGMAAEHHRQAIGLLQGELAHFYGKEPAAVNFHPFGSARLERLAIGMI